MRRKRVRKARVSARKERYVKKMQSVCRQRGGTKRWGVRQKRETFLLKISLRSQKVERKERARLSCAQEREKKKGIGIERVT